jgi:hypothetical protein
MLQSMISGVSVSIDFGSSRLRELGFAGVFGGEVGFDLPVDLPDLLHGD